MWLTPERLAQRAVRLAELAAEQGRPTQSLRCWSEFTSTTTSTSRAARRQPHMRGQYRLPLEVVERWSALGSIERVLAYLEAHVAAGVDELVLMPLAREPLRQYSSWLRSVPACALHRCVSP